MKKVLVIGVLLMALVLPVAEAVAIAIKQIIGGAVAYQSSITPPVVVSNIYTSQNGVISKIAVSSFTETATLNPLSPATPNYLSVSVDSATDRGYYITDDDPAQIAKVNLVAMTLVSSISLGGTSVAIGEPGHCSVIDATYVYFCYTDDDVTQQGIKLVRIALSTFTAAGTVTVDSSAVAGNPSIFISNGFIYILGAGLTHAKVYKIDTSTFTLSGTLTTTIAGGTFNKYSSKDASGNGYFSIGTSTVAGKVDKVSLSGLTETANLSLTGFTAPYASSYDSGANTMLIGDSRSGTSLSHIGKIDVATFTVLSVVQTALAGCRRFNNSVIDSTNVFFATNSNLICKYLISDLSDVSSLALSGTTIYDMTAY